MSLHLWVYKCPQDMRRNGQVCEYELALLVQAEQGEVVAQLHGLNGVFLLQWVRDQSEVTVRSHHPTLTAIIIIIIPVVTIYCYLLTMSNPAVKNQWIMTYYLKVKQILYEPHMTWHCINISQVWVILSLVLQLPGLLPYKNRASFYKSCFSNKIKLINL